MGTLFIRKPLSFNTAPDFLGYTILVDADLGFSARTIAPRSLLVHPTLT